MKIEVIRKILPFIVVWLVQVLVLNHVTLFGCATPLLYVYFIMMFSRGYPRWAVIVWSFCLGVCIDIFSNTPGVAASAATLLGFLQPYLLEIFAQKDDTENIKPSMATLGVPGYTYYTLVCVFIFTLVYFSVESFSLFNWLQLAKNVGGSTLLTSILIIVIENLKKR